MHGNSALSLPWLLRDCSIVQYKVSSQRSTKINDHCALLSAIIAKFHHKNQLQTWRWPQKQRVHIDNDLAELLRTQSQSAFSLLPQINSAAKQMHALPSNVISKMNATSLFTFVFQAVKLNGKPDSVLKHRIRITAKSEDRSFAYLMYIHEFDENLHMFWAEQFLNSATAALSSEPKSRDLLWGPRWRQQLTRQLFLAYGSEARNTVSRMSTKKTCNSRSVRDWRSDIRLWKIIAGDKHLWTLAASHL